MSGGIHAPILTGADKLLALVEETHKITISDAAHILGTSSSIVGRWVEVLEDQGAVVVKRGLRSSFILSKQYYDVHGDFKQTISLAMKSAKGGYVPPKDDALREQQRKLAKKARQIQQQQDMFARQERALAEKTAELAQLRKAIATKKEALKQEEHVREEMQKEFTEYKRVFAQQQQKLEEVTTILSERVDEVVQLKNALCMEKTEKRREQKKLKTAERNLKTAQKELKKHVQQLAVMQEQTATLRSQLQAKSSECSDIRDVRAQARKDYHQELKNTKNELARVKKDCVLLAEKIQNEQQKRQELLARLNRTEKKYVLLKTQKEGEKPSWTQRLLPQSWL